MEKWALPYEDVAARLQRPELKIMTLQKACSCVTQEAFAAAQGAAAHAAVLGLKGVKRGDLVAVLNPSLLPKAEGSESRAATIQDEDQILHVGSVKGIMRCAAMTKRQAQCRQIVHTQQQQQQQRPIAVATSSNTRLPDCCCCCGRPSMGEYCRFHANAKETLKPKERQQAASRNMLLHQAIGSTSPTQASSSEAPACSNKRKASIALSNDSSNSTSTSSSSSSSSSSSADERERQAVQGFVKKLKEIVALPAGGDRDMALAIQLSLAKRMRFVVAPQLAEEAKHLHTQLFLHSNSELALLAFKNYRYLHQVSTLIPTRHFTETQQQQQQQQRPSPTAAATPAAAAAGGAVSAAEPRATPVPAASRPAAAAAEAAADVRRVLKGLQQPKQRLVHATLATLKQTQKANATLQKNEERQLKLLLKQQQQRAKRAAPAAARAASRPDAAIKPAATGEAEKKLLLEKMLQLRSCVADIVDQASPTPPPLLLLEDEARHLERLRSLEALDINHEFKQTIKEVKVTAFFCIQCNKFTDRLNPACAASGHHQQPRQATKRFVQCRVASKHLSFRVISLYTPKAEKLLEQEKLSIDGTDVGHFKRQQPPQKQQRTDDDEPDTGILEHNDLPAFP
ncbi:hypothetical protein Esti_004850 [Eimeria stiedai]